MSNFKHLTSLFRTPDHRYWQNVADAEGTYARPALIGTPEQEEPLPGVAVFNGQFVRGVYPVDEALRLATQIADSIAYHKQKDAS